MIIHPTAYCLILTEPGNAGADGITEGAHAHPPEIWTSVVLASKGARGADGGVYSGGGADGVTCMAC